MLGVSIAGGRFEFGRKIGAGTFGTVYYGIDRQTTKEVGIKIEPSNCKTPRLEFEASLYRILGPCRGLPTLAWYGQEDGCNVLIMELLGPSLRDLMRSRSRFSFKTVLQIGHHALNTLQYVHSFGLVHCDVKPANLLIGRGEDISMVYLVDFGLARRYWSDSAKTHIPYRIRKASGITGTAKYASINAHHGVELTRRDDVESLAYTLIYMARGRLPWQEERKDQRIGILKSKARWEDLVQSSFPILATLLMTACCLEFSEAPDYAMMRRWIAMTAEHEGIALDGNVDWTPRRKRVEPVEPPLGFVPAQSL